MIWSAKRSENFTAHQKTFECIKSGVGDYMLAEYAMYKGENLLHIGTLDELAEAHGVRRETIYYYSMPAYRRKRANSKNGNFITIIKLEDEDK